MDKYEYREKTEQLLQAAGQGGFERAAAIADTIQWERCRNVATLCKVASIYERTGQYEKSQRMLFMAYAMAKNNKKIVYQLGILAIKMGKYIEAQNCYEEFVSLAPKDPNRYILEYRILKAECAPLKDQIAALEKFKSAEYLEQWGYELALLYHQAGMDAKCVEECEDLILWFSESEYVYKAMELKMQHKELSDLQKEKYIRKFSNTGSFVEPDASKSGEGLLGGADGESDDGMAVEAGDIYIERADENAESADFGDVQAEGAAAQPGLIQEQKAVQNGGAQFRPASGKGAEQDSIVQEALQPDTAQAQTVQPGAAPIVSAQPAAPAARMEQPPFVQMSGRNRGTDAIEAAAEAYARAQAQAEEEARAKAREEERRSSGFDQRSVESIYAEIGVDVSGRKENEIMVEESEVGISEDQKLTDSFKIDEILSEWDEKQNLLDTPAEEPTASAVSEPSSSESELDSILSDEVKALMAELEAGLDSAVVSGDISKSEEEKKIEEEKSMKEEQAVLKKEPKESREDSEASDRDRTFRHHGTKSRKKEVSRKEIASPEEEDGDIVPEIATILDEPSRRSAPPKAAQKKEPEEPEEKVPEPTIQIKKPVPQDTGFIIEARYDLEATSEIGTKVGLTEEQKQIFSYFVPVRGMSEQIMEVLSHDKYCRGRAGSSRTGNILVIGHKGSGKTVLAVDVVKAIQKQRQEKGGKVAIVNAASLNKKNISDIFLKLKKGALIIEEAGKLHPRTVEELNVEMEKQTGELLVILEEEREPLKSLIRSNVRFAKKFTAKLEVPVFTNDELVTFAQTYAKENGFKLDDLAILALYSRIDTMQKENHAVSVTEVKDILDEAMNHSRKSKAKKFVKRLRGKAEDEEGRTLLNEHDFV